MLLALKPLRATSARRASGRRCPRGLHKRAATAQQEMCSIHGHLVTRLLVGLHRPHGGIQAVL